MIPYFHAISVEIYLSRKYFHFFFMLFLGKVALGHHKFQIYQY